MRISPGGLLKLLLLLAVCTTSLQAQQIDDRLSFGIEHDFLPYITGGYYAGVWVGKSHFRGRILMAHVHKPSFITPDGFTNNTVTAYAFVGDYFLKENWSGWWISGGLVLWNSSIQSDQQLSTVTYNNTMLNGSLGYQWKFYRNFYLSPWAGLHLRIGGAKTVTVDGKSFDTPILTPEASLKLGWYFNNYSN